MTVTIDKFGRILIPKALRDRLGLAPGTALALGVRDGEGGAPTLELRPDLEGAGLVREGTLLVHRGRLDVPGTDIAEFVRAEREARIARLAGFGPRGAPSSEEERRGL